MDNNKALSDRSKEVYIIGCGGRLNTKEYLQKLLDQYKCQAGIYLGERINRTGYTEILEELEPQLNPNRDYQELIPPKDIIHNDPPEDKFHSTKSGFNPKAIAKRRAKKKRAKRRK